MPPSSSTSLDLARALTAFRRGLIDAHQLRTALSARPAGGSVVEALRRAGAIDDRKLAALFEIQGDVGLEDKLEELVRDAAEGNDPTTRLDAGEIINGRYRVIDKKTGGFGCVFLCDALQVDDQTYERGNRRVALKTPLRERLVDAEAMELFRTEAANWISLGAHPNLVLAYGVEEHHRLPFIVMEFVEDACTLADEIARGRLELPQVLHRGLGVARALAYVHQKFGLAHGDIKPLNILVTRTGGAKVADFGLSVGHDPWKGPSGTRGYIAPEMYLGRTGRSPAADVYAFGATLYEAATGALPFPRTQADRNTKEPAPDIRRLRPEVPAELAKLIDACLQREPSRRPRDFGEIVAAIETMYASICGETAPSDAAPDAPLRGDALVNATQSWLNLGDWKKAESTGRDAVKVDGRNWKAWNALGLVYYESNRVSEAVDCFDRAHALAPDAPEPPGNLALAWAKANNPAQARRWLEVNLRLATRACRIGDVSGCSQLIIQLLDAAEAERWLDAIVAANPGAVIAWNNRAIFLRRQKRFAEALASADRALALNPTYGQAWSNRATILVEMGRLAEAIEAADRSIAFNPQLAGAHAAKAAALARAGRKAEARACIEHALRTLPGNPLLLRAREAYAG